MNKSKIVFHPKFLKLFREEVLNDMLQKCELYTKDENGCVDLILIMGQNLNVQMDCGLDSKPLIIENLDSIDEQDLQMSKSELLERLKQFESEEIGVIFIDETE